MSCLKPKVEKNIIFTAAVLLSLGTIVFHKLVF